MAELHDRFHTLDRAPAPDLWAEIEQRATATVPEPLRVRFPAFWRAAEQPIPAWRLMLLLALLLVTLLALALVLGRDRQGGTSPFVFKSIGSAPALHAVDVETGESTLLIDGSVRKIHVSPDGRYALLEAAVKPTTNTWDPGYALVLAPTNGSEVRIVSDRDDYELGDPWESIWAPDSHAVSWMSDGQLKVLDMAAAEPITIDVELSGEPHLVWSPDSIHIAYVNWGACRDGQTPHLFVVDTVATDVIEVGDSLDLGSLPGWSHDGGRIAASVRTGSGCPGGPKSPLLVVHDVATGRTMSTEVGDELISPVWSPDDTTIIGQSAGRMLGMPAQGGELTEITEARGEAVRSPDGGRIAWLEPDGATAESYSLWVADAVGGERRRIAENVRGDHPEAWPRWSPDGDWIAFARPLEIWVIRPDGSDERVLVGEPFVPDMTDVDW